MLHHGASDGGRKGATTTRGSLSDDAPCNRPAPKKTVGPTSLEHQALRRDAGHDLQVGLGLERAAARAATASAVPPLKTAGAAWGAPCGGAHQPLMPMYRPRSSSFSHSSHVPVNEWTTPSPKRDRLALIRPVRRRGRHPGRDVGVSVARTAALTGPWDVQAHGKSRRPCCGRAGTWAGRSARRAGTATQSTWAAEEEETCPSSSTPGVQTARRTGTAGRT